MPTTYTVTDVELTSIADAIRAKGSTSASLTFPSEFISAINDISTGGGGPSGTYLEYYDLDAVKYVIKPPTSIIPSSMFLNKTVASNFTIEGAEYITSMSMSAFYSTNGLKSLSFPNLETLSSTYNFYRCLDLESVYIPKIDSLPSYCFAFCSNLSDVTLSSNLNSIGTAAFQGTNISEAIFPNVTYVGNAAFASCRNLTFASIPNITIGEYSIFASCNNLISVSLPNVSILRGAAFYSDSSLQSIYLPSLKLISYSGSTFYSCSSLSYVSFPELEAIQGTYSLNYAWHNYFFRGTAIENLDLPKLSSLAGYNIFNGMNSLKTFSFPSLAYMYSCSALFMACTKLQSASFPSSITYINNMCSMFQGCYSLSAVAFPGLVSILYAPSAFLSCGNLKDFNAPLLESITNATCMFSLCAGLESLHFPKLSFISNGQSMFNNDTSLHTLWFDSDFSSFYGNSMFYNCRNFISLFLLGSGAEITKLATSFNSAFSSTPFLNDSLFNRRASVYVPSSKLASYKTATNWTVHSSLIYAYEDYFGPIGHYGDLSYWSLKYTFDTSGVVGTGGTCYSKDYGGNVSEYGAIAVEFDNSMYFCAKMYSDSAAFGAPRRDPSVFTYAFWFHDWCPFNITDNIINISNSTVQNVKIYIPNW